MSISRSNPITNVRLNSMYKAQFHPIQRTSILGILSILLPLVLSAQDGWKLLEKDQHLLARKAFEQRLERDSLDESALKGMILLCDIQGDEGVAEEYMRRYLLTSWDEPVYHTFPLLHFNQYSYSNRDYYYDYVDSYERGYAYRATNILDSLAELIDESPMGETAKRQARLILSHVEYNPYNQCASKERNRDSLRSLVSHKQQWNIIGPFEGDNGRGHEISYPVEDEPFNLNARYEGEGGLQLQWVRSKEGRGLFSQDYYSNAPRLPMTDGVYYANTFLKLNHDRRVQIRVTRSNPIMIWVDDRLLFSKHDPVCACQEGEILELDLEAGVHRLLVKLSPDFSSSADENEYIDQVKLTVNEERCRSGIGTFKVHITDMNGRTANGVQFLTEGEYLPAQRHVKLFQFPFLDHFQEAVESNPEDLFSWYMLGKSFIKTGKTREGEKYFALAVRNGRDNALMRWMLAQLYSWNGKLERIYETLSEVDTTKAPIHGLILEELNKVDSETQEEEYLRIIERLYDLAPSNYSTIHDYISYYDDKGLDEEKDAFIDRAIANYPPFEEVFASYKSDYERPRYNGYDYSEEYSEKELDSLREAAISEDCYASFAYFSLIRHYRYKDRHDSVLALYNRAIEEYPQLTGQLIPQKIDYLSDYYKDKDEHDSVLAIYSQAIEEYPELLDDLSRSRFEYQLGYYKRKDNLDSILRLYDQAIEKHPEKRVVLTLRKVDYMLDEKKKEEAKASLKKFIVEQKGLSDTAWNDKRKEDVADLFMELKEYEYAIPLWQELVVTEPYNIDFYENLGTSYLKAKDTLNALKIYQHAVSVDLPGDKTSWSYGADMSIGQRIDVLGKRADPHTLFESISFEDVLADDEWQEHAKDQDALVLLHTYHQVLDTLMWKTDTWQKMMVAIQTEEGAEQWTQRSFYRLGNIEYVKILKASGEVVTPDRSGGFTVFKDLEPGDIIQVEGREKEKLRGGWQRRQFDQELISSISLFGDDPVYRTRVELLLPAGKYIDYRLYNLEDNVVKSTRDGYDSYLWDFHHLPRDFEEDALLDDRDMYRAIAFSTLSDWSKVVDWYLGKTYRHCEVQYDIKDALDTIVAPGMSNAEKVEAVYNYLTRTINYSGRTFLQNAHIPRFPETTLSAGIGDCKDVAGLMITMLRDLGIESHFTLVKTNFFDHRRYPPSRWFDHAITAAFVDGEWRYYDLTTDFYPHNVLPDMDAGAWALLIKEGETEIFQLPYDNLDAQKNLIEIDIDAFVDTNRSIELTIKAIHRGVEGANLRETLARTSQEEMETYILRMMGDGIIPDLRLVDVNFENTREFTEPLRSTYQFQGERFTRLSGNFSLFRLPFMIGFQPAKALRMVKRRYRLDISQLC